MLSCTTIEKRSRRTCSQRPMRPIVLLYKEEFYSRTKTLCSVAWLPPQVVVPLPDGEGRAAILAVHLRGTPLPVTTDRGALCAQVARVTRGTSLSASSPPPPPPSPQRHYAPVTHLPALSCSGALLPRRGPARHPLRRDSYITRMPRRSTLIKAKTCIYLSATRAGGGGGGGVGARGQVM